MSTLHGLLVFQILTLAHTGIAQEPFYVKSSRMLIVKASYNHLHVSTDSKLMAGAWVEK